MPNLSRYLFRGVLHEARIIKRTTPRLRQRRARLAMAMAWGAAFGLPGIEGVNEARAEEYAFTRAKQRNTSLFARPLARFNADTATARTRRSLHEIARGESRFNCRERLGNFCTSDPANAAKDDPTERMDIQNKGWLFLGGPGDNNYAKRSNSYRKVGKLTSQGNDNALIFTDSSHRYDLEGPVRLIGTGVDFQMDELPYRIDVHKDMTLKKLRFRFYLFEKARRQAADGQELATILVRGKADDSDWLDRSKLDDFMTELNAQFVVGTEKIPGPDGTRYVFTLRKKKDVVPAGERGGEASGGGAQFDIRHVELPRVGPPATQSLDASGILAPVAAPPFATTLLTELSEGQAAGDGSSISIIEKEPPVLVPSSVDGEGQKLPTLESIVVVESSMEGVETDTVGEDEGEDAEVNGKTDSKDALQAEAAKEDEATVIVEVALAPITEEAPVDAAAPPPVQLADFVTTPNQKSVALAVDSLPASHPVSQAAYTLLATNPNDVAVFSSAISGEVHPTLDGSMRTAVEPVRDVSLAQLRAGLFGGRQPGALTADAGVSDAPAPASVLPSSTIYPAWAQVTGNWQHLGGRDHSAKGHQRSGGVFIGMDEAIGEGWRMGGALGYTDSRLNVSSLGSTASISSYSAILYGGKIVPAGPGAIHMMLGGAYTWHDVRTRRRVMGGGLDQDLRADYGADTTQVFAELGYAVPVTPALTVQPYVGLSQASNRRRSFNERGGSAALSSKRQHSDTTTVTVGVRGTQDIKVGRHDGQVSGALGWRRNSGDLRTKASMSFDVGDSFTVTGAPVTRDSLLVETGFKVHVGRSAAVSVNYAGQFGGGTRDHSASLNVSWRF